MARIAFTLRIDAEERAALENLSQVEGRPINQLLNEAIKSYLSRRSRKEQGLEANLAALRAYRKRDPGFQEAIAAFVEAEATIEDPVEGDIEEQWEAPGPVQNKIRVLMGA
jgi:predicted transcriptional regulator